MRWIVIAAALAVLTGCGADGPPVRPSLGTTVSAGSGGVSAGVRTGIRVGAVNLGVGVGL